MPMLGPWLRRRASQYEEGSVVEIKSGLAEGLKWKRHHRYVNGYWTGQYEYEMQLALKRELSESGVFWDVGANAGFFSLIARRLVGERGEVVSFDPDPDNGDSVQAQIDINGFGDAWRLERAAVGGEPGVLPFRRSAPGSPKGHLAGLDSRGFDAGETGGDEVFEVPVVTMDAMLDRGRAPDLIKMDIEGAEVMAMGGAARLLREHKPTWLVELHGPESERVVREALTSHGYSFFTIEGEPVSGDGLPRHFMARHAG